MPRNDEVYIPGKSQAEFKRFVRSIGGVIGKTIYTRGEIVESFTPKWQQEVAGARILLGKFQQSHAPDVNMRIFQGITKFLGKVLPIEEIRKDIDWEQARAELADIFSRFLVDEIPQGVSIRQTEDKAYFVRPKTPRFTTLLMPQDISFILLHYGLTGEKEVPMVQLAKRYNMSPDVVRERVQEASRAVIMCSVDTFWA